MEFKHFSFNGRILPAEQAVIPLSNIEYSYGFGVYETIRVLKGAPYFLKDHLDRLRESAKIIGLEHPFDLEFIRRSVTALVQKYGARTFNLKILLIGGSKKDDAKLFILCLNPLFPDKKLYKKGATFITYRYERAFPRAKTLNMLQSYLAYRKARDAGAYDALFINRDGFITEGTRTNFFCVKGKTIITPDEKDILLGITRKALLQVAPKAGYIVKRGNIKPTEVKSYDGAFITGTPSKIIPVAKIDDIILDNSSGAVNELMRTFDRFLENCGGKLS